MVILGLGVVLDSNPSDAAGYENLAEFSFDKADGAAEATDIWETYGNEEKAKKGIQATGGLFKDNSLLFSAVSLKDNDANYRKLKWGDAEEKIKYNDEILEAVPLLSAAGPKDETDPEDLGDPWAGTPFFRFETKTTGYDGIRLSLKLGGTKKGPRDFILQYSIDGDNYTNIDNTETTIEDNKILYDFSFTTLPDAVANQDKLYLRFIVTSEYNIGGNLFTDATNSTGGSLAINDIIISGKTIGSSVATDVPPTASPAPTAIPAGCFAAFNFSRPDPADGATADTGLDITYKTNGAVDGYKAISGTLASSSTMYASLNGTDYAPLSWNGESNAYTCDGKGLSAIPVLDASETTPWGKAPFFLFKLSTTGYDKIRMSFKLGGTKKGPKNYKLQYSTDNKNFTDVKGGSISISNNKELFPYSFALPSEAANKETIYIKLIASDELAIGGEKVGNFTGLTGGEAAINDIVFEKVSDSEYNATPAPTNSPKPTKVPASATPVPTKVPDSPEPSKVPDTKPSEAPSTEAPYTEAPSTNAPSENPGGQATTAPQPTASAAPNNTAAPVVTVPTVTTSPATTAPTNKDNATVLKKLSTPKLTSYKRGAKVVKGTSIKKAKITLQVGKKKYSSKANAKGKFTIKLKGKLKKGTKLTLFATKSGFTKSSAKVYKVK